MLDLNELATKNADLGRWTWPESFQPEWKKADTTTQEFYKRWRDSASEELETELHLDGIIEFSNMPEQFIVRKAYRTIFDHVWQRAFEKPDTGVVLTGQPGIGKTCFLWYTLIRLIKKRQPVAFANSNLVLLFYGDHVWRAENAPGKIFFPQKKKVRRYEHQPFLFVLIDLDVASSEPVSPLIEGRNVFPIQASSRNPRHFEIWSKRRTAAIWGLHLWDETELNLAFPLQPDYEEFRKSLEPLLSRSERSEDLKEELQEALNVLDQWRQKKEAAKSGEEEAAAKSGEEEDETLKIDMNTIDGALKVLVHAACRKYGPVARDVFQAIFSPGDARAKQNEAVNKATFEQLKNLVKSFRKDTAFPDPISHLIVLVKPVELSSESKSPPHLRLRDDWKIEYRSPEIACEMTEKLETERTEQVRDYFELFRNNPQSSAFAGCIFENIANRSLRTDARRKFALVKMRGEMTDDAPVWDVEFGKDVEVEQRLPGGDRHLVYFRAEGLQNLSDQAYYVPEKSNFPLFDSFLIERPTLNATDAQPTLWVFQMSTSARHSGSRQGYVSIRKIINSLKSSFEAVETKDGDGKTTKMQKREIQPAIKYVYVVPCEKDHVTYQWRCPGGWNKNVTTGDHRGVFYCLRLPIPSGNGHESAKVSSPRVSS